MKQIILLSCFLAVSSSSMLPGLRVRWGLEWIPGTNYIRNIPMNTTQAVSAGWEEWARPDDGHLTSLIMYCPVEKILCLLYDDTGYIAGAQVGLPVSNISDVAYDLETMGYTEWNTKINGEVTKFLTIQQYYINEEYLQTSSAERIANRDSDKVLQVGGVWLVGNNKDLTFVNSSESAIGNTSFTKQSCIWSMGTHYFHNMSSSLNCSADTIYPWFLLFHDGELVAVGAVNFLVLPEDTDRDWFERPSQTAVEIIAPRAPSCLYELASIPGALTMHLYFVYYPYLITC